MATGGTLSGKVAIVSGSVGGGIGEAIAVELSSRGAHVVLNYPSAIFEPEAAQALQRLATPGIAVEADLSTVDGPAKLVQEAVTKYGFVDILVNNASIAVNAPLEEHTLDNWDQLANLNGRGYLLLTQAVLKHLAPKDGRIVNIASISAFQPPVWQTLYAGTKGMQIAFTRVWAKELPPKYHCTVNSVSPGPTKTKAWDEVGPEALKNLEPTFQQTPVGQRMARVEEVSYAVAMLCEPRAGWVNGTNVTVSGGLCID
ncbi:hypothetical protein DTO217A2_1950 [Paecilomyces variotii]|nr:hypothetical protein DTO217A2_1950 [Paecilomyces variotii]